MSYGIKDIRGKERPFDAASKRLLIAFLFLNSGVVFANARVEKENSNIGAGHFVVHSLSPGHLLRPNVTIATMAEVPKGACRVTAAVTWGNIWNYERDHFIVDGEWITFDTRISYALKDGLEVGLCLPFCARTGGFMDYSIEKFHEYVDCGSARRKDVSRNEVLINIENKEGRRFVRRDESWGVNDIPVFASYLLTRGDMWKPAVALQAGLTIPVGDEDEIEGLGEMLYEAGLLLSKRVRNTRSIVFCGVTASYSEKDEIAGIPLRKEEFTGLVGVEYETDSPASLVAQYLVSSPVARDYYMFSEPTHEIHAGFKWKTGEQSMLECCVTENFLNLNNSTDVGIHIGWSRIF